jgi:hypothetical protein
MIYLPSVLVGHGNCFWTDAKLPVRSNVDSIWISNADVAFLHASYLCLFRHGCSGRAAGSLSSDPSGINAQSPPSPPTNLPPRRVLVLLIGFCFKTYT